MQVEPKVDKMSSIRCSTLSLDKEESELFDSSLSCLSYVAIPELEEAEISINESTSSSTVSAAWPIEEDVKHQVLTEKANMNIKPHLGSACIDYKIMVREENSFKNLPEWDSSGRCLMHNVIESKQNYAYAYELLEKTRKEQALTRSERDTKIEELKNEQIAFGESFSYFDKFVKDNFEKRERAFEKIKAEQVVRADVDSQIKHAETKIDKLTEIKEDMLQCISDRKIFVDFLEEVRAMAPAQYGNGVHEIAERFELLLRIREELANDQAEAVKTMQELSNKMFRVTDEHTEELINLRNKSTELMCRYDKAKHDTFYWESVVNVVEEMTAAQSRRLTRVKTACWNLYLQICEHHELPVTFTRHQVQEQLGVIENTILLLRRALSLVQKKKKSEKFSYTKLHGSASSNVKVLRGITKNKSLSFKLKNLIAKSVK